MNSCNQIRAQISLYLDEELGIKEQREFESHIAWCDECLTLYNQEKSFLENIRAVSPLYETPAHLRAKISEELSRTPEPFTASASLRRKIHSVLGHDSGSAYSFSPKHAVAFALILIAVLFAGLAFRQTLRNKKSAEQTSDFAMMAVDTHLRHLRKQLPLEIIEDSPEKIKAWFAGKVSFNVEIPNYQESSGQAKLYSIEGARLVALNNDYAAYIAYQMNQKPITLVITSNAVARPSGGEEIVSKGLTFHYDTIKGQKVITWSDRGLTYALVSDLEERGQQSCFVCHTGTKDRDFIEGLKP